MSVAPHADGGCFKHASYVAGVQSVASAPARRASRGVRFVERMG